MKMETIDRHGDENSEVPHFRTQISGSSREKNDQEDSLTDQNSS